MPYHHYIPRFILRGFIPEDTTSESLEPAVRKTKKQKQRDARKARKKGQPDPETISVFNLQSRLIESVPVATTFGLTSLYEDASNQEDLEYLEKKLSELEGKAARVIRELHVAAGRRSSNQTFTLPRSDLQLLRKFIFLMHYRSSAMQKTYFQEDHPDNAPIRQWIRHLKKTKGYTTDKEIWLDGLRYYLFTKHSDILDDAKKCPEYGTSGSVEADINIPSQQWHALAYESLANDYYLGIWRSHEDSEFVLGNDSYGLWEGRLAGSRGLFRIYVLSPKITVVLKLIMSRGLLSPLEDSTLSDHPLGLPQTVYNRGPHILGNKHADPGDRCDALQRHLRSPNSNNDQFTFRINGLAVDQTYIVNQIVLENLHADGLLLFASRDAMLRTAQRYDTSGWRCLGRNRQAIAGLIKCLESGAGGNPSSSTSHLEASTPGLGNTTSSSFRFTPLDPNFTRPPSPMFVRPRFRLGLDDLMLPQEVVISHILLIGPGRLFSASDQESKDVLFDILLFGILEGSKSFKTEYDRARYIHRNFPPLQSTSSPLVHFIAERMDQAKKLLKFLREMMVRDKQVKFPLGTPTKLVDSLEEEESRQLLEMLSFHVKTLALGWVGQQWEGERTESQKILEQVTMMAYLELLLEEDPNLAASLCSSVSFIEVVTSPEQPGETHAGELEETTPMRNYGSGASQSGLKTNIASSPPSSPPSSPFSPSKSSRKPRYSLGDLLLPREVDTDSVGGSFSELDWAFDDMLRDVFEGSVKFETEYERALHIHRLFPPLPNTLHPLVRLVAERTIQVEGMVDAIRERVQHRTGKRAQRGGSSKVMFGPGARTKLVDSLSPGDAIRLFTAAYVHFEPLGWVGSKWDTQRTPSPRILEEVTVVACLKVLLEVDPNLAASLCSSFTFIGTVFPDASLSDDETGAGADKEDRSFITKRDVPGKERRVSKGAVPQSEMRLWTNVVYILRMFFRGVVYLAAGIMSLVLVTFIGLLWDQSTREIVGSERQSA
ncbi:hypothetical protein EST38_g7026 [Candolleomyces aberdarensis]|uniref:Uncharacterized protein n=1 Tax=Candolleomyces aberdarensis TaxID=2316362 RepID=A0A4Q2DI99_9AGAR|nr:hypothetical protein EST38_g7026 [Candolleomyces aberdarensis]